MDNSNFDEEERKNASVNSPRSSSGSSFNQSEVKFENAEDDDDEEDEFEDAEDEELQQVDSDH